MFYKHLCIHVYIQCTCTCISFIHAVAVIYTHTYAPTSSSVHVAWYLYIILSIDAASLNIDHCHATLIIILFSRYLSKCGDFFDYFVSSHLKRVEFNPTFPVLEFLALFYKYTFKQPEVDSFCVCLMTWNVFLDHLVLMSKDTHTDLSPHSSKHYERYNSS